MNPILIQNNNFIELEMRNIRACKRNLVQRLVRRWRKDYRNQDRYIDFRLRMLDKDIILTQEVKSLFRLISECDRQIMDLTFYLQRKAYLAQALRNQP